MKTLRKKTAISLALAALAGASPLQATAPAAAAAAPAATDDLSLADLLNIKLQTGSFLELDLSKSPLSMTIIDKEKLKVSGARDMSEALEIYVPGFQYMYNRWNGKIWGMRGVVNDRNTKILVLVNGHKMNTEARDGFFQELSIGLLNDVERIEVLRGPAGLVYGSGAIAGIVNIVTKRAGDNPSDLDVRAGTWSNFGSTYKSAQGNISGKIAEDQSVRASLGWEQSDGLGNGVSRIYGTPMWPYPFWVDAKKSPASVPGDGSTHKTPGNWKGSVDYEFKGFRLYGRFTHQVQEAGGLFIRDPWPQFQGDPSKFKTQVKTLQDQIAAIETKFTAGTATAADSLNRVDLRSQLSVLQLQASALNMSPAQVDGKNVDFDDPFWSQVESWNNNRREYVADNIALEATYDLPLGDNTLKLKAGMDGNSNIIQREMRPGYEAMNAVERNSLLEEAFGERRYTLGATYLMKNLPKLQLAAGMEQRFDDIGSDLFGRNSQQGKAKHKIVTDILYTNTALFTEGWYDLTPKVGIDFGLRWDGHTRTIDQGGTTNGKLAAVVSAAPGHTVKAIFQTSSNNGTADNYEYNRNNYDDNGQTFNDYHFYEKTTTEPGTNAEIVPGVSEDLLHELKPEKVYSFELTSNHDLGHGVAFSPSVSYNMVRDLFAWSQKLFRVVNVGAYDNLNFDFQLDYKSKYVEFGANHAIQSVVNTDVDAQAGVFNGKGFVKSDANGPRTDWYVKLADGTYVPRSNAVVNDTINPVKSQITYDGENFMALATHNSKLWVDVKPTGWLTFHNDFRVFWGLTGRDSVTKADQAKGYESLDVNESPIVKWNASLRSELPGNWSVGVHVYDILGIDDEANRVNLVRWNQSYDIAARDLFAVDYRSYAIDIRRSF